MDEETAYENRPFVPWPKVPRDLVEDLQWRCNELRSDLRRIQPVCMEDAREYDRLLGEIEELESQIVAIEEGVHRGQH